MADTVRETIPAIIELINKLSKRFMLTFMFLAALAAIVAIFTGQGVDFGVIKTIVENVRGVSTFQ